MIVFHQGKSLREKFERLRSTDLALTTWLVSDLRSKSELQKELLLRTKCLPEDAVIRVSEFWQKLFHQIQPDFELISSSLTTTYLAEWLEKRQVAWANHPGTPKLLFSYIDFFLPILTRVDLIERTREWLRANPSALIRWGSWFELSIEAWQLFLEQKTIARQWASGYLSGLDLEAWPWHRNLILDLGADMTGVEAELIGQIAHINGMSVEIYTPDNISRERYSNTLWPYSHLLSEKIAVAKNVSDVFSATDLAKVTPKRFTSPLAEVKAAANEVYRALASGLSPSEIGIFAAQVEDYWPVLESYLRTEGIPFAKGVVLSGVSLPSAARWLARMRVEAKEISSGDLEHSVFGGANEAPLSFDKFAQLYSKIYEVEDLDRDEKLRETLTFKYSANDRLDRDQFFDWSLKFWEGDSFGADKIAAAIFQECPTNLRLELRSWIRYVEAILPKIEISLREGDVNGIHVGNFDSAAHLQLKKAVLIGLSESQLADQNEISVSHGDVIKIASDLGINLANLGSRSNAYWVEQVVRQSLGGVELYFAATNSAGEPETPSVLWLEVAATKLEDAEQCFEPPPSRWDEIQRAQLGNEETELKRLVSIDAGLIEPDKVLQNVPIRYSVSQIENYLKCPFIFTAQKLLKLSDLPDVDLDIDNMTRGRLLHAALDRILVPPLRYDWSRDELVELVDMLRDQMGVVLGYKEFWPTQRERYVDIIVRFLGFEQAWRAQYGSTKTVGREVVVQGELALSESKKISVFGKIDRVDSGASDEFVVLDYKSTGFDLRNHSSWLGNDELQLLFYAMCIEEGLVETFRGTVIGAFYYILANMNREKGFRDSTKVGSLFAEAKRSRTQIDRADLLKMFSRLKEKILTVITHIEEGRLYPHPIDHKICTDCAWKTICRAPHLN